MSGACHPPETPSAGRVTAALGHEHQFAPPRPSDRCGFPQEAFAGVRGNEQDAPIPDLPTLAPGRFDPSTAIPSRVSGGEHLLRSRSRRRRCPVHIHEPTRIRPTRRGCFSAEPPPGRRIARKVRFFWMPTGKWTPFPRQWAYLSDWYYLYLLNAHLAPGGSFSLLSKRAPLD
jgi:hypothetical protein